jgi:hypothetical protein
VILFCLEYLTVDIYHCSIGPDIYIYLGIDEIGQYSESGGETSCSIYMGVS